MERFSQTIRLLLICSSWFLGVLGYCQTTQRKGSSPDPDVNPRAIQITEFQKNVAEYVSLHNNAAAPLGPLKPTESPEKIAEYQRTLATRIRNLRPNAKQGDLFTPSVTREFRRLIQLSLQDRRGKRVRASLHASDPARINIEVNASYPQSAPLETTPPTLLLNFPKLPREVEYRIVGRTLLLRDVTANLIVDFIPEAFP